MKGFALVTGGAKRLGRACAEALAEEGYGIALHYNTSAAEAEAFAAALQSRGTAVVLRQADLADSGAALGLVAAFEAAGASPVTALINSASLFEHDVFGDVTPEQFERQMRVNALSPTLLMQAFAKALPADRRGAVVNFLDYKLAQPYPDHLTYTMSKYALLGATELGARALAPRIRVNAVAPGYVLPAPNQTDGDYARLHSQTPLGYGATANDVAEAVRLLVTNDALTAQTIYVDAGLRMAPRDRDFSFL
jgi:NAD(P)-dependent dehydrogenase (short-subunit alcohol dehydrogenase family)